MTEEFGDTYRWVSIPFDVGYSLIFRRWGKSPKDSYKILHNQINGEIKQIPLKKVSKDHLDKINLLLAKRSLELSNISRYYSSKLEVERAIMAHYDVHIKNKCRMCNIKVSGTRINLNESFTITSIYAVVDDKDLDANDIETSRVVFKALMDNVTNVDYRYTEANNWMSELIMRSLYELISNYIKNPFINCYLTSSNVEGFRIVKSMPESGFNAGQFVMYGNLINLDINTIKRLIDKKQYSFSEEMIKKEVDDCMKNGSCCEFEDSKERYLGWFPHWYDINPDSKTKLIVRRFGGLGWQFLAKDPNGEYTKVVSCTSCSEEELISYSKQMLQRLHEFTTPFYSEWPETDLEIPFQESNVSIKYDLSNGLINIDTFSVFTRGKQVFGKKAAVTLFRAVMSFLSKHSFKTFISSKYGYVQELLKLVLNFNWRAKHNKSYYIVKSEVEGLTVIPEYPYNKPEGYLAGIIKEDRIILNLDNAKSIYYLNTIQDPF
jgi:hypothetical protein